MAGGGDIMIIHARKRKSGVRYRAFSTLHEKYLSSPLSLPKLRKWFEDRGMFEPHPLAEKFRKKFEEQAATAKVQGSSRNEHMPMDPVDPWFSAKERSRCVY